MRDKERRQEMRLAAFRSRVWRAVARGYVNDISMRGMARFDEAQRLIAEERKLLITLAIQLKESEGRWGEGATHEARPKTTEGGTMRIGRTLEAFSNDQVESWVNGNRSHVLHELAEHDRWTFAYVLLRIAEMDPSVANAIRNGAEWDQAVDAED